VGNCVKDTTVARYRCLNSE